MANRTHTKFATLRAIAGALQTQRLDARTWVDEPGAVFSELRIQGNGAVPARYSFRDQVEQTAGADVWHIIPVAELSRIIENVNLRYVYIAAGGAGNVIVTGTIRCLPNVTE